MNRSLLAAIQVGVIALAAARSSEEQATIGGELRVYNWEDYFSPTTLEDFGAEFGVEALNWN